MRNPGSAPDPPTADPGPGAECTEPAMEKQPPPPPRAEADEEMGGEAPCQLHRFWDVEE